MLLEKQLKIEDILEYYKTGETSKKRLGLEYERISLDKNSFLQADFNNIFKIIEEFSALYGFQVIFDDRVIIGAKNDFGTSVSLEPGGQFEISLLPKESLSEIFNLMRNYVTALDKLGEKYNTKFFSIGNNPKNCFYEMKILNKRRYRIMADYLPKIGKLAPVMMRETAGVQVNVDYKNEDDAMEKIKACSLMSPFLTGFFANSPFRGGKLTSYKSVRALAWKYTGIDRCGLFYRGIIDNPKNLYEQYANYIFDVPMLFIIRNDKYINIEGRITFRDFIKNGFMGHFPTLEDYILHQSLCFPDIRLKNCIEIRNHDSQNLEAAVGIAAIYKGILYNSDAVYEILDYFKKLNSYDLESLGFLSSRYGIDYNVEKLNIKADTAVKKILYLARESLDYSEKKYLDFFIELADSKKCIADLVLENVKQNTQNPAK